MMPGPKGGSADPMLGGKVIVVTGAASGIGAAAARLFGDYGAAVACLDRDAEGAARTAADVPGAFAIGCDVSDEAAIGAALDAVMARHGRLDGAFNNAGIEQWGGRMADFGRLPRAEWDRVLAVNVTGVMLCLAAEVARMGPGSAIVNTGSVMSVVGAPGMGAYAVAKHAVLGITRVAALDHAPAGIRVNAVLPGAVRTPMLTERAF
ncbi:MAG: SDR family NAD(P)-dependent oxidoreductase, partial [Thermaurantiacus sp.]